MATYLITNPKDGRKIRMSGEGPPPPEKIAKAFAELDRLARERETLALNKDIGGMDALALSLGRGVATVGRGLGLMEPESEMEKMAYGQLQERFPKTTLAGEVIGESAPFLAPGIGLAAIPTAVGRVAGAGLLGATQGAILSRGQEASAGETLSNTALGGLLASGLEVAIPLLGRAAGSLVRRVSGKSPTGPLIDSAGNPTIELKIALEKTGLSMEDLAKSVLEEQPIGVNPEQAARKALFEEAGIPATKGDISQDFAQQALEGRLQSMAMNEASQPLRDLRGKQSQAFYEGVNSLVDNLGMPKDVGDSVKDALSGRLENLKQQKNALYKKVAETSPKVSQAPLFTDTIMDALPSPQEMRRMSRLAGNNIGALEDLLVEFGIDKTPELVDKYTKSGGQVIPLNLGNFEEFRVALNQFIGGQSPGEQATAIVAKKIKSALDDEATIVEKALLDANATNAGILEDLRKARGIVATTKKEFSPDSITGRLIGVKRDNVTPIIEASKVFDVVAGKTVPIERLERTVKSLMESGAEGQKAMRDLQAATVMRALDDSLKAVSLKSGGVQTINYPNFVKSLNAIGDDKLALIFKNNQKQLADLKRFKKVAENLVPDARTQPKGSAPVILDIMQKFSRLPGMAVASDAIKYVVRAGADDRAVAKAIAAKPDVKRSLTMIQNDYPSIASALGIPVIAAQDKSEK